MKIVTQKGTTVHEGDLKPSKWAGVEYREEQAQKISSLPYGTVVLIRRGTGSMKISEYPPSKKITSLKGFVISTSRGTATRIL